MIVWKAYYILKPITRYNATAEADKYEFYNSEFNGVEKHIMFICRFWK